MYNISMITSPIQNKPSFLNWQGNSDLHVTYGKWIALALALVIILTIFLFKDKIHNRFKRGGKILFFKSDVAMWQTIGVIGLIVSVARAALFWVYAYPLYWENLGLHLCRLHLWIIFALLATKKLDWIKYITYISIIGAFFGILFNNENSLGLNNAFQPASDGTYDALQHLDPSTGHWTQVFANSGDHFTDGGYRWVKGILSTSNETLPSSIPSTVSTHLASNMEAVAYFDGFKFYHIGWGSIWIYEFIASHLFLIFLPLFARAAYKSEYTNTQFARTVFYYMVIAFTFWIINIAMDGISNPHWRANFWYIGRDRNNDFIHALGAVSAWPQNLFVYALLGTIINFAFHFIWIVADKVHFHGKGKNIFKPTIGKSDAWNEFKKGITMQDIREAITGLKPGKTFKQTMKAKKKR